jgi:hypothetical protein
MAADPQDQEPIHAPLQGTRAQSLQRLQVGLGGLLAMILLVGLANIIMERARQTEAGAVALGRQLGKDARVATILADTGFRYLSTLYNAQWLEAKGLPVFDWLRQAAPAT